jgi:hypothetical protein
MLPLVTSTVARYRFQPGWTTVSLYQTCVPFPKSSRMFVASGSDERDWSSSAR